jgi:hypothetical protein
MKQDLVRISHVQKIPNFPLKRSTLYKWLHLGRHPELFVRLSNRAVFVDLAALERLIEASRLSAKPRRKAVTGGA